MKKYDITNSYGGAFWLRRNYIYNVNMKKNYFSTGLKTNPLSSK